MAKMQKEYNLSKNQQIVFDIIEKSSEPVKAYSILFNVKKKGKHQSFPFLIKK